MIGRLPPPPATCTTASAETRREATASPRSSAGLTPHASQPEPPPSTQTDSGPRLPSALSATIHSWGGRIRPRHSRQSPRRSLDVPAAGAGNDLSHPDGAGREEQRGPRPNGRGTPARSTWRRCVCLAHAKPPRFRPLERTPARMGRARRRRAAQPQRRRPRPPLFPTPRVHDAKGDAPAELNRKSPPLAAIVRTIQ